jgi:hypothetical protein
MTHHFLSKLSQSISHTRATTRVVLVGLFYVHRAARPSGGARNGKPSEISQNVVDSSVDMLYHSSTRGGQRNEKDLSI